MSKKIMVVDDSRMVQLQLQKVLSGTDYQVVACCQSGEEAVETYGKVNPDLVTMDILMPGMDGLELLDRLQKENMALLPILCFCPLCSQYPDTLRCTGRQRVACGRPVRSTCKNLRRIYRQNQAFNA